MNMARGTEVVIRWLKVDCTDYKQDNFLAICIHKGTINYINDQEDIPPVFL